MHTPVVGVDVDPARREGDAGIGGKAGPFGQDRVQGLAIQGGADDAVAADILDPLDGDRQAFTIGANDQIGIAADRITVISKGKETPFCTESNEACWQQNRRGHFIITAK